MKRIVGLSLVTVVLMVANLASANKKCPKLYHKGVIELDINPAFLNVDQYDVGGGEKTDGLTVSSFYNMNFREVAPGTYAPMMPPFAADQVGRIMDIGDLDPALFDPTTDFEKLTDVVPGPPKTVWPNEAKRIPDGVLDFEAVIVPQGFHAPPAPGRLSIIRIDTLEEYIVHQSTLNPNLPLQTPGNSPRFYHDVLFYDMDGDGLKDIVTVRGGFRVTPTTYPPFSELVYFRNPGEMLDPATPWQEVVLYGGPMVGFMGPDIHLAMHDFDGDDVPEIVATHFFTGDTQNPPTKGKIAIYGAPAGGDWSDVNLFARVFPRVKTISEDNGFPFGIKVVDLNADGQVEILATNHQLNCTPYPITPGQVYAIEPPASGNIFDDDWTVRVLFDGIRPQPSVAGAMRMAPGHAIPFFPKAKMDKPHKRPWILVSGDEAGKVWVMKPKGKDWDYDISVIFDINDYYGPETTQTFTPNGVTISTIGKPALRYADDKHKRGGKKGVTEIYIPVFEAQDIHVFSFEKQRGQKPIQCPADVTLSCE